MGNFKLDLNKLDTIIKKTIDAINNSKNELFDIAESARKECKILEEELKELKEQVKELVERVDILENDLKESRRRLMLVSKNTDKYSQEEIKKAYEKADALRIELAVKREQEQFYMKRRNELEVRIKHASSMVQKADNLMSHVGVALNYMTSDLQGITVQLEDMHQRQMFGLKIIKAQEDERQRVARDIHDGPAQSMSNVVLKAEICERLMDVDVIKAKDELKQLKRIVRESLQDVRKIIYNLRPMSLDDLGLIPTLQRYLMTFQDESGMAVSFKTRGAYDDMKSVISLAVFRIVQEAMSNINKHSSAQNVIVNLEFLQKDLKLYIFDDGRGFDMEKQKEKSDDMNGGFGLVSMRERVELLGGKFDISSEPGKGTRINISIPLIGEEGALNG